MVKGDAPHVQRVPESHDDDSGRGGDDQTRCQASDLKHPCFVAVDLGNRCRLTPKLRSRGRLGGEYNTHRGYESVATTAHRITDEDLLRLPQDGWKHELVDGEIRVSPAGARHGAVAVRLTLRLRAFVVERKLGHIFESSAGFRWPGRKPDQPDNLRSPDLSFVAAGRFLDEREPVGFVEFAPDLAVEVLSPDDRRRDVLEKIGEYLDAGTRLVWVIDPEKRTGAVYRSLTDVRVLGDADALEADEVVPGFACLLRDVLG
jgi:Uma2 family endonuclease